MKTRMGYGFLVCASALCGACGNMPEALLDSVRESAKEAVQAEVGEMVDEFAGEALDADLLLEPVFPQDDEE